MTDLSPDLTAKLSRLLPRLASDASGEVNATVQAIRRTLDRAGLDLHDLTARLTEAPRPVPSKPVQPKTGKPNRHAQPNGGNPLAMAAWLRACAADRLTPKQRDFVETAARLLTAGRVLTPKQAQWLADLHAQHATRKEH